MDAAFHLRRGEDALHVDEAATVFDHAQQLLLPELEVLLVADGDDQAVQALVLLERAQREAVLVLGLGRVAAADRE